MLPILLFGAVRFGAFHGVCERWRCIGGYVHRFVRIINILEYIIKIVNGAIGGDERVIWIVSKAP